MVSPLPSVESACCTLSQEESQRELHKPVKEEGDMIAMFSKTNDLVCIACGKHGHLSEKCWTVVGYPPRHPKYQKDLKGKSKEPYHKKSGGYNRSGTGARWNKGGVDNRIKMAANAKCDTNSTGGSSSSVNTGQIEKPLKMLLTSSNENENASDDEMDMAYSNMVSCYYASTMKSQWRIDTGASHHMTGDLNLMENVRKCKSEAKINLPTGETSCITHVADVKLKNDLTLFEKCVVCSHFQAQSDVCEKTVQQW